MGLRGRNRRAGPFGVGVPKTSLGDSAARTQPTGRPKTTGQRFPALACFRLVGGAFGPPNDPATLRRGIGDAGSLENESSLDVVCSACFGVAATQPSELELVLVTVE